MERQIVDRKSNKSYFLEPVAKKGPGSSFLAAFAPTEAVRLKSGFRAIFTRVYEYNLYIYIYIYFMIIVFILFLFMGHTGRF